MKINYLKINKFCILKMLEQNSRFLVFNFIYLYAIIYKYSK